MYDLSGLHLLVTRPRAQADPWAKQLIALGARVTCEPMLVISPLSDKPAEQKIRHCIGRLDEYQQIIFVSQNAVNHGIDWIDHYWPQLPVGPTLLAIGSATAALLANKLMQWQGAIESPLEAMNSEALLQLPALQGVEGHKILIFRGQGGRTYLADTLASRGAQVEYCELYQRQSPTAINAAHIQQFKQAQHTPVVVVHSGETLDNLWAALPQEDAPWFQQQALLVPSERVAQQAQALAFQQIITADNATHEGMIGALYEWRQTNKHSDNKRSGTG